MVVPRLQACLPHAGKASAVIAYVFPIQMHSYQHSPRQGGSDQPGSEEKNKIFKTFNWHGWEILLIGWLVVVISDLCIEIKLLDTAYHVMFTFPSLWLQTRISRTSTVLILQKMDKHWYWLSLSLSISFVWRFIPLRCISKPSQSSTETEDRTSKDD